MTRASLIHELTIHYNFLRVVVPQFKISIAVFLVVNLLGSLVIWADSPHLTFAGAAYTALALNFFEVSDPGYPQDKGILIQAAYFVIPAVGLIVIAEGVVRLGVVIFNRKQLSKEWHMALAASFKNHVVIAGLGRIGSRVARRLQTEEQVVCIENRQLSEMPRLSENVALISGDATHNEMLQQANVAQARAILALTDNDLANLEIALSARESNPEIRVVLRMFNEKLGQRLVEQFGFQAVYSTSALAAPSFSAALYSNKILQTIQLDEEKTVHMARIEVAPGSKLIGKTLLQVEEGSKISVLVHHTEGTRSLLPAVNAEVRAGDELYVLAELSALDQFDRQASG